MIIDCCAEAAVEVSRKDIHKVFNTNLVGTFNLLKKSKKDKSKIRDEKNSKCETKTSIARKVAESLGVNCNRKLVQSVLTHRRSSKLDKLNKIA